MWLPVDGSDAAKIPSGKGKKGLTELQRKFGRRQKTMY
jgi:hypothetical protein